MDLVRTLLIQISWDKEKVKSNWVSSLNQNIFEEMDFDYL